MNAATLLKAYDDVPTKLIRQLQNDAGKIKRILVSAIAENHPDHPFVISTDQYTACRRFLSAFDHIYTLNYDVLLYWALMHEEVDELNLIPDDGFRHPEDDPEAPYVSWQEAHAPKVHYLHGALHLFDADSEIIKYTWSKTGIRILDQIREALDEDRYPLFVSEGNSRSKQQKILHNAYLHKAYRSFETICDQRNSSLFIFGHSLSQNDDHILKRIARGRIAQVFISLHGKPNSKRNKTLITKTEVLSSERNRRKSKTPLSVAFYDASTARVWG